MQTANFRDDLMYAVAYKMGLDPTTDLSTDLAAAYVSYINAWVRRIYPNFDWPEWTWIEQRTPDAFHVVQWAQPSQKVIGRVLKLYLADPTRSQGPIDIPFKLYQRGVHCGFEHGTTVYLKYIEAAPEFTSEAFSDTKPYNITSITYDPTSGNCYHSLQNGNVGHDPPDPLWWDLIEVPTEMVDLVARGAYSDALREDGQTDKAAAEEQAVIAEANFKRNAILNAPYDLMTDQSRAAPRYNTPPTIGAAGGS